jgi:hypothetical protein
MVNEGISVEFPFEPERLEVIVNHKKSIKKLIDSNIRTKFYVDTVGKQDDGTFYLSLAAKPELNKNHGEFISIQTIQDDGISYHTQGEWKFFQNGQEIEIEMEYGRRTGPGYYVSVFIELSQLYKLKSGIKSNLLAIHTLNIVKIMIEKQAFQFTLKACFYFVKKFSVK